MQLLFLDGSWRMSGNSPETSDIPATIPGDNYSALIDAGVCPDPYWSKNELDVQRFRHQKWSFRRTFSVSEQLLANEHVALEMTMVDTFCTVFINGRKVGECSNCFARYAFEVKPFLVAGENAICLIFAPIDEAAGRVAEARGGNYPQSENCKVEHLNQVRKPFCSGGWDWGITLATCGVYENVLLRGYDNVLLKRVYTRQVHRKECVELTLIAEIFACEPCAQKVCFECNGERQEIAVEAHQGMNRVEGLFTVTKPRLWWPSGYGEAALYPISVTLEDQSIHQMVGLRTVEVIHCPDKYGVSFFFRVNGIDIFAKGANWIPCDALPARQTPERYESLLETARVSNMNMIRVWGGGMYEREIFYDLCDRKGLLVWQDMMFAVAVYPADDAFLADVERELDYQIPRLRSHACLALWCGDNECIGCVGWLPQEEQAARQAEYLRLHDALARKVRELDPERSFWPGSPSYGPGKEFEPGWQNDRQGDMHYWNVWHGGKNFEDYFSVKPRFCSEFGYQSFPSMDTVATYCPPEEYEIHSPAISHHQKCPLGNQPIFDMFAQYFREPEGFENFLQLSQVQQALAIKTGVEFWRTCKPRCMGTLYWQLNDNWPVASWAGTEYGGKWKMLQYEAVRFFAPVMATMLRGEDGFYRIYAVNDLPCRLSVKMREEYWSTDGRLEKTVCHKIVLKPNESKIVARYSSRDFTSFTDGKHFVELFLEAFRENEVKARFAHRNSFFPVPFKEMTIIPPKIHTTVERRGRKIAVSISSDAPAFFVSLRVPKVSGEFSDNNITLLPNEIRRLDFLPRTGCSKAELKSRLTVWYLECPKTIQNP